MKKIVSLWLSFLTVTLCLGQNEKNLELKSPGTLSMQLSHNDLEETNNLTLSGRMNAKDFSTIALYMNNLRVLNLKNVKIEAYTGTTRPQIPSSVYPENQIPAQSFQNKKYLTQIILPDNLTAIREEAFAGCTGLSTVKLPGTLKIIGNKAFEGCTNLQSITIPKSVISIEDLAFNQCSRLSDIKLNEGIQTIGKSAFSNCISLEKIDLPYSLTNIGNGIFINCKNLKVIYSQNPEPIKFPKDSEHPNINIYKQATLYVPANAIEKYSTAIKWRRFKKIKPIG